MESLLDSILDKRKTIVLKDTVPIYEAARAMESNNIGAVLIADERGNCYGIVTDRDITLFLASGEGNLDSPLEEIARAFVMLLQRFWEKIEPRRGPSSPNFGNSSRARSVKES